MALSSGQIADAFKQALGRSPTGTELSQYSGRNDLEGSPGQQQLIAELGGSAGGGQIDQAAQLQKQITDAYNQANTQYQSGISAYDKAHPFVMSDVLAKEATNAAKSISPYYDQLLTNYMTGVNYQKGNTLQDEMRAVTKLQADSDAYTGQAKAMLNTALTQAGQSYANAGSYDSGARARNQGIQTANTQYDIANRQRQTGFDIGSQEIAADRTLNQTIPLNVTQYEQQQARNKATDLAATQAQNVNYDVAMNNYNRAQAGLAAITGSGQFQSAGAFPGQTSAATQTQLQSLLPGVTGNLSTPLYAYS